MRGSPAGIGNPRVYAALTVPIAPIAPIGPVGQITLTILLACTALLPGCRKSVPAQDTTFRPPEPAAAVSAPDSGTAATRPDSGVSGREPAPDSADEGFFGDMDTSSFVEIDARYAGPVHQPLEPGGFALLVPGGYHSDEVQEGAEKEEWLALHADSAGRHRLSPARIRIEKFFDPIVDKDSAVPTGKAVSAQGIAEPVKFLVGGPGLSHRSVVDTADIAPGVLGPGYRQAFWFRGVQYELACEPFKEELFMGEPPTPVGVSGWSVLLAVNDAGREPVRLLLGRVGTEGAAELLFAGDLDGDGRLDLILNQTRENVLIDATLFLSGPAEERVLKAVAVFLAVGC